MKCGDTMLAIFLQAHKGDHAPLIKCFIDGMRKTLESIQKL